MPDKWEYPWYAAWDLAFHCVPLALVDPRFRQAAARAAAARVVHAPERPAAGLRVGASATSIRRCTPGRHGASTRSRSGGPAGDRVFLERVFQKLLLNFTWWVNRKDAEGNEHLPGRLPRPRQHRRVRSQSAAAHRRPPGAIGRHELDGDVLPEHARHRHRARRTAIRPTRTWRASSGSTSSTSRTRCGIAAARRSRTVGRAKTASSTTCCTCRMAASSR